MPRRSYGVESVTQTHRHANNANETLWQCNNHHHRRHHHQQKSIAKREHAFFHLHCVHHNDLFSMPYTFRHFRTSPFRDFLLLGNLLGDRVRLWASATCNQKKSCKTSIQLYECHRIINDIIFYYSTNKAHAIQ